MRDRMITKEQINQFEAYLMGEEKSENTCQKYLRDVLRFANYMEGRGIRKEDVINYKNGLLEEDYAVRSVNSMLASLNTFFGLHDYEITDSNLQYKWEKCRLCGEETREFNDKEYVIDIGNGETATVVGHYDLETAEEMVVELNKYRKQKFRFELKRNEKMMEAARIRAAEIEYYFQHDRPNGKKITVGENITGARNASAEYITRNIFANSPDHNANMLIANYRYCGCAIFCVKSKVDGEYGMNVVQMFSDINENSVPSILGE